MLKIQITGLTENQVEALAEVLDSSGLEADEDFAIVYGEGWRLVGVRLYGEEAAQAVMNMEVVR